MIYNEFQGMKLSALGLGCMRFPVINNNTNEIDVDAVREMVRFAMENGINYYDTAWGYHGGNSEKVIGEILKDYPRESYLLATKFPGYDLSNMAKVKEIFPQQLAKCGVEYFDFYLFHNVSEINIDAYLDPEYKILETLLEEKKKGHIRHLGFSAHGSVETMRRFLEAYGAHMEFCQIQLNWLDWELQDAKEKLVLLKEFNLPVWVMEPLRGGKLATLETKYEATLKALRPKASAVEWAFRFLQALPQVTLALSGMSNMAQLKENIAIFSEDKPLNQSETDTLLGIAHEMTSKVTLPCTACRYCTEYCKKKLDIPRLVSLYNDYVYTGGGFLTPMIVRSLPEEKKPSACIGCKACEKVCPQGIKISNMMQDFTNRLNKK